MHLAIMKSSALEEAAPKCALWLADVVKVRMQLQTLHLASDGTRLVAPNLVKTPKISLMLPLAFHVIYEVNEESAATFACQHPAVIVLSRRLKCHCVLSSCALV